MSYVYECSTTQPEKPRTLGQIIFAKSAGARMPARNLLSSSVAAALSAVLLDVLNSITFTALLSISPSSPAMDELDCIDVKLSKALSSSSAVSATRKEAVPQLCLVRNRQKHKRRYAFKEKKAALKPHSEVTDTAVLLFLRRYPGSTAQAASIGLFGQKPSSETQSYLAAALGHRMSNLAAKGLVAHQFRGTTPIFVLTPEGYDECAKFSNTDRPTFRSRQKR